MVCHCQLGGATAAIKMSSLPLHSNFFKPSPTILDYAGNTFHFS
jgi:hypothetical protein